MMKSQQGMPPYAALGWSGGTALRYDPPCGRLDGCYRRDAGAWSVNYKWKDGVLMTKTRMRHINNVSLVGITEEQWRADNDGHA